MEDDEVIEHQEEAAEAVVESMQQDVAEPQPEPAECDLAAAAVYAIAAGTNGSERACG